MANKMKMLTLLQEMRGYAQIDQPAAGTPAIRSISHEVAS